MIIARTMNTGQSVTDNVGNVYPNAYGVINQVNLKETFAGAGMTLNVNYTFSIWRNAAGFTANKDVFSVQTYIVTQSDLATYLPTFDNTNLTQGLYAHLASKQTVTAPGVWKDVIV